MTELINAYTVFPTRVFRAKDKLFTLYNEFVSDPSLDPRTCLTEQRAEWLAHFPPDKMRAWTDCAKASFAPATGDWRVQMLDLADGRRVAEWQNGYVWGRLRNFVPGYPETFVSRSWISGSASIRKATALKLFGSWPSIRISFGSDWGSCRLPCVRASSSRLRTPYLLKALPDRPGAGSGRLRRGQVVMALRRSNSRMAAGSVTLPRREALS